MVLDVDQFDMAYLLVGQRKYFCALFTVLSHCDDIHIISRNTRVEEFTLKLPRENYPLAPHRIKFIMRRNLRTFDFDYLEYKTAINPTGEVCQELHEFFDQDKKMRMVNESQMPIVNSSQG